MPLSFTSQHSKAAERAVFRARAASISSALGFVGLTAILITTGGAGVAIPSLSLIAGIYVAGNVWLQRREDAEDARTQALATDGLASPAALARRGSPVPKGTLFVHHDRIDWKPLSQDVERLSFGPEDPVAVVSRGVFVKRACLVVPGSPETIFLLAARTQRLCAALDRF